MSEARVNQGFYTRPDITGHFFLRPSIWVGESCSRIFSALPPDANCWDGIYCRAILPILVALAIIPSAVGMCIGLPVKGLFYICSCGGDIQVVVDNTTVETPPTRTVDEPPAPKKVLRPPPACLQKRQPQPSRSEPVQNTKPVQVKPHGQKKPKQKPAPLQEAPPPPIQKKYSVADQVLGHVQFAPINQFKVSVPEFVRTRQPFSAHKADAEEKKKAFIGGLAEIAAKVLPDIETAQDIQEGFRFFEIYVSQFNGKFIGPFNKEFPSKKEPLLKPIGEADILKLKMDFCKKISTLGNGIAKEAGVGITLRTNARTDGMPETIEEPLLQVLVIHLRYCFKKPISDDMLPPTEIWMNYCPLIAQLAIRDLRDAFIEGQADKAASLCKKRKGIFEALNFLHSACRKYNEKLEEHNKLLSAYPIEPIDERSALLAMHKKIFIVSNQKMMEEFERNCENVEFLNLIDAFANYDLKFAIDHFEKCVSQFPHHTEAFFKVLRPLFVDTIGTNIAKAIRDKRSGPRNLAKDLSSGFHSQELAAVNRLLAKVNSAMGSKIQEVTSLDLAYPVYIELLPREVFVGRSEEDKRVCFEEFEKCRDYQDEDPKREDFFNLLWLIVHTNFKSDTLEGITCQLSNMDRYLCEDCNESYPNHVALAATIYRLCCSKETKNAVNLEILADSEKVKRFNSTSDEVSRKLHTDSIQAELSTDDDREYALNVQEELNQQPAQNTHLDAQLAQLAYWLAMQYN